MNKSNAEAAGRATPGVSQEELWQSHRMRAIGRLTDGVAHEFNNRMQGIVAFLELTRKLMFQDRIAEAEQLIAKAIASAQNAALLHQCVASFARSKPIAPSALSINTLVANVEAMLRHSLSRAFELEIELAGDLWPVCCDAGQAEIVIVDMVLDARDSMPGGGSIAITTHNHERPDDGSASNVARNAGHWVCVAVMSTGDRNPEAFDRGSTRLSPADARERAGALDMVNRFACIYGGEMRLRENPPHQCTTELYLPRFAGD
jgi:signal transduction histidine kinase